MIVSDFDIHGIVSLKIHRSDNFLKDAISNPDVQYNYFLTKKPIEPDIVVFIDSFSPDLDGCTIVDQKYHIKQDYLYFRDAHKIARWEAEISGFEKSKITIRLNCNLFGLIFSMGLIEFFIRYLFVQRGYAFIHAFGVHKEGKGMLFPARSGVGKTVSTIYFLEDGYSLLSDNFVIVKDKTMYAFPTPMNVFTYNLTDSLKKRISKGKRLGMGFKNLLYQATMGYVKFLTPVQIEEAFPGQILAQAEIDKITFTAVADKFTVIENVDKTILPARFCAINQFETVYQLKMIEAYTLLFVHSQLSGHWGRLAKVFKNTVAKAPCAEINVPACYSRKTYAQIKSYLSNV